MAEKVTVPVIGINGSFDTPTPRLTARGGKRVCSRTSSCEHTHLTATTIGTIKALPVN
jgi:hypothetical protein